MTPLAWVGIGMLVLAGVLILIAVSAVVLAALRLHRVLAETRALVLTYRLAIGISGLELQLAAIERHELLRPWRRVRRWVMHPLTIALFESWRRRRGRPHQARLETTTVGLP